MKSALTILFISYRSDVVRERTGDETAPDARGHERGGMAARLKWAIGRERSMDS